MPGSKLSERLRPTLGSGFCDIDGSGHLFELGNHD